MLGGGVEATGAESKGIHPHAALADSGKPLDPGAPAASTPPVANYTKPHNAGPGRVDAPAPGVVCMQSPDEPEFWCRHDGSSHSIYCPAGGWGAW